MAFICFCIVAFGFVLPAMGRRHQSDETHTLAITSDDIQRHMNETHVTVNHSADAHDIRQHINGTVEDFQDERNLLTGKDVNECADKEPYPNGNNFKYNMAFNKYG